MKKYILSLCALLSIGQCYSMQDAQAHQAIVNLHNLIKGTDVKRASQDLFVAWNQTISAVTSYAINNSKNALGQQDMNLITTATVIRDINNEIIILYRNLQKDILSKILKKDSFMAEAEKYYYEIEATRLKEQLHKENPKLTTYHASISKQKAQSILRETIKRLSSILDIIENKVKNISTELH